MDPHGTLYVVATPIGNLEDLSPRAERVLKEVDLIAAEDTRHASTLCQRFGIDTRLQAYHDFSSASEVQALLDQLQRGLSVALISDAGTPLIADPGFRLVQRCRELEIDVLPIPGPSALTAVLSAAGLPSDRFVFEGFLPAKKQARQTAIAELAGESRSIVLYESPHRIEACMAALALGLGNERRVFLAREISKKFEAHFSGTLEEAKAWLAESANNRRGEFALVLAGADQKLAEQRTQERAVEIALILRASVSDKEAVRLACQLTGARKNPVYAAVLASTKD